MRPDKELLQDVTVIIPAHNRPERLERLLNYYKGSGVKILVADSSTERYRGDLSDPDVEYSFHPQTHFLLKLRAVMERIRTKYVVYCADDDFAVPAAIARMAEFLDANPDYSVAQGHYLTFVPSARKISFYPRYIRYFNSRIDHDSPAERMLNQQQIYATMLYGVARADAFKRIYSYCFEPDGTLRFSNLFLAEEFFNHAMLLQGKYATLPHFFSAREKIPGSATETVTPLAVVEGSEEHEGYIRALALMAADTLGLALEEADALIRRVCARPKATPAVGLKRRIVMAAARRRWLRPLSALLERRYNSKGLRAVRGMASYPCEFTTPDRDAIVAAVRSTRKAQAERG